MLHTKYLGSKLQLEDLDLILRESRLRWFSHVERSSGAIRTAYDMQIDGKRGAGRPKQTWKKLTEKLMWMMPLQLHINQKSDYDIMISHMDSDKNNFSSFPLYKSM